MILLLIFVNVKCIISIIFEKMNSADINAYLCWFLKNHDLAKIKKIDDFKTVNIDRHRIAYYLFKIINSANLKYEARFEIPAVVFDDNNIEYDSASFELINEGLLIVQDACNDEEYRSALIWNKMSPSPKKTIIDFTKKENITAFNHLFAHGDLKVLLNKILFVDKLWQEKYFAKYLDVVLDRILFDFSDENNLSIIDAHINKHLDLFKQNKLGIKGENYLTYEYNYKVLKEYLVKEYGLVLHGFFI